MNQEMGLMIASVAFVFGWGFCLVHKGHRENHRATDPTKYEYPPDIPPGSPPPKAKKKQRRNAE